MTMGNRIRKLRKAAGWTQVVLGYRVGLSVATISKMEKDRLDPRVQTVQILATALGCSVPHLLYGPRSWWTRLCDRWPVLEPLVQKRLSIAGVLVDTLAEQLAEESPEAEPDEPFPRQGAEHAGHEDARRVEEDKDNGD